MRITHSVDRENNVQVTFEVRDARDAEIYFALFAPSDNGTRRKGAKGGKIAAVMNHAREMHHAIPHTAFTEGDKRGAGNVGGEKLPFGDAVRVAAKALLQHGEHGLTAADWAKVAFNKNYGKRMIPVMGSLSSYAHAHRLELYTKAEVGMSNRYFPGKDLAALLERM